MKQGQEISCEAPDTYYKRFNTRVKTIFAIDSIQRRSLHYRRDESMIEGKSEESFLYF